MMFGLDDCCGASAACAAFETMTVVADRTVPTVAQATAFVVNVECFRCIIASSFLIELD